MEIYMFKKDLWYAAVSAGDADATSGFRIFANRLTTSDRTILHNESMDGNKEHVQLILREFAGLLVKVDSNKDTALHLAAFYGHAQVVELLIDAARNLGSAAAADDPITCFEAFIRHPNNNMNTALHVAVSKGNLAIAKLLAEADPDDAHIQNCNGDSPVNLAARLGYYDMVILICKTCTNPSLEGPDGSTALHAAIIKLTSDEMGVCFEAIQAILEVVLSCVPQAPGAHDAEAINILQAFFSRTHKNDSDTPLYLAARKNHLPVVKLIAGLDPDYITEEGFDIHHGGVYKNRDLTALIYELAARNSWLQGNSSLVVRQLCNLYEQDNILGHFGQVALRAAIMMRDTSVVNELLTEYKLLVTYTDDAGWTPLHYAASYNFEEVLELIVNTQNSVGYECVYGEMVPTPLCVAISNGHTSMVIQLMRLLPNSCLAVNHEGQNILHLATVQNNKEMIRTILKYCPIEYRYKVLNRQDVNGCTALHILIREGCFVPEYLKYNGVSLGKKNHQQWTCRDMLYWQDEIIGDQLLIKKVIDDIMTPTSTFSYWKCYRGIETWKTKVRDSVVPVEKRLKKDAEFEKAKRELLKAHLEKYARRTNTQIIVTALIATVAFTLGFTMPGGYHQSGEVEEGLVVLSKKTAFQAFVISDVLALVLSISSLFLYFISSMYEDPYQVSKFNTASTGLNIVSIIAMMLTFITGTYVVLSHAMALAITVCLISSFFFLLVIILTIKMIYDHKVEKSKPERFIA